jgi:hypothetical protein
MTRHSFGLGLACFGMILLWVRIGIQNHMQHVVARLAPPKTNRPFKNLAEALDWKRVRTEYERLFPVRSRGKFMWIRVTTITGAIFLVIGFILVTR